MVTLFLAMARWDAARRVRAMIHANERWSGYPSWFRRGCACRDYMWHLAFILPVMTTLMFSAGLYPGGTREQHSTIPARVIAVITWFLIAIVLVPSTLGMFVHVPTPRNRSHTTGG